jgi:cytochrome c-type biogenesis protein
MNGRRSSVPFSSAGPVPWPLHLVRTTKCFFCHSKLTDHHLLFFLLFLPAGATPVLTSILAFVAAAHNNVDGTVVDGSTAASTTAAFLLLLSYSLGYSTPLLLVAGTGGQALAKLKGQSSSNGNGNNNGGLYQQIGPWVTPITGAILLWYGTTGLLTSVFGDPSLFGLPVLE